MQTKGDNCDRNNNSTLFIASYLRWCILTGIWQWIDFMQNVCQNEFCLAHVHLLYCSIKKKKGLTKSNDWKDSISNFRPHQTTITLIFLENNHRIDLTRSSTPKMMSLLSLFTGGIKKTFSCCLSSTKFLDCEIVMHLCCLKALWHHFYHNFDFRFYCQGSLPRVPRWLIIVVPFHPWACNPWYTSSRTCLTTA